jgi:hypothetical protein
MNEDEDLAAISGDAVNQLKLIQLEYAHSSNLLEFGRSCREMLAELALSAQFESDTAVQLGQDELSTTFGDVNKAYLVSDLVVVSIDSTGKMTSKALQKLPPATIMAVTKDSTPQFRKLISDRRERAAMRIASLEGLVRKLTEATIIQPRPEDVEQQEPVVRAEEPDAACGIVQEEHLEPYGQNSELPAERKIKSFNFIGSFHDRNAESIGVTDPLSQVPKTEAPPPRRLFQSGSLPASD